MQKHESDERGGKHAQEKRAHNGIERAIRVRQRQGAPLLEARRHVERQAAARLRQKRLIVVEANPLAFSLQRRCHHLGVATRTAADLENSHPRREAQVRERRRHRLARRGVASSVGQTFRLEGPARRLAHVDAFVSLIFHHRGGHCEASQAHLKPKECLASSEQRSEQSFSTSA